MTTCEDVLDLLPEVLPRLTPKAIEVHEHLRTCPTCAEESEELTRVLHALETEGQPTPALPDDFADKVVGALPARSWLHVVAAGLLTRTGVAVAALALTAGLGLVGVRLYVDQITFRTHQMAEPVDCYVAARNVDAGRTVSWDDITEVTFPRAVAEAFRKSRVTDKTVLIGVRLVQPIEAGQVFQTYHFAQPRWRAHGAPSAPDVVADGPGTGWTHASVPAPRATSPVAPTPPTPPVYIDPPSLVFSAGPAVEATPATSPSRRASRSGETTLVRYVTEAGHVLEAVAVLDEADPHWMRVLSKRVDDAALLDQGERLLIELRREPDQGRDLRPLIAATQLVLRKVRHASAEDADLSLVALRREVTSTGLLDAYRTLLARDPAPAAPSPVRDGPF